MSGEFRRKRRGEYVAVFEFDSEDCRAVASTLSSSDGWAVDLLAAADELDEMNTPDPDAPGLSIVVTSRRRSPSVPSSEGEPT